MSKRWPGQLLSQILFFAIGIAVLLMIWRGRSSFDASVSVILVLFATFCFLISLVGQNLLKYVRSIGPGGIEFQAAVNQATSIEELPLPTAPEINLGPGQPFNPRGLVTDEQRWAYKKGMSLLFYLDHSSVDPIDLEGRTARRYRALVLWIGRAALSEDDCFASLRILQKIEGLPDLTFDEAHSLGLAYWMFGEDQPAGNNRAELFKAARNAFRRCIEIDPDDALSHYALGWACDELGRYDEAIRDTEKAIAIDEKFADWGHWTIAVSQTKKGMFTEAVHTLATIPRGELWQQIGDDLELKVLADSPKGDEFAMLRRQRTV